MTSTEPTYTLAEARVEMERQGCARRGHVPNALLFSVGAPDAKTAERLTEGRLTCQCGEFVWSRSPVDGSAA